jgi:hypothetical protein
MDAAIDFQKLKHKITLYWRGCVPSVNDPTHVEIDARRENEGVISLKKLQSRHINNSVRKHYDTVDQKAQF